MRKIICFLGQEGSGKSYNSNKLLNTGSFIKLSFADTLREMAFKILGMNFNEGMEKYAELKRTEIYNGQNFRNILENLGSVMRDYSKDFWVDALIKKLECTSENVCIDDMRYPNEFIKIYNYCQKNDTEFKAYYCNYNSNVRRVDNPHESAALANYLFDLNYKDLQEIDIEDILTYTSQKDNSRLKSLLKEAMGRI